MNENEGYRAGLAVRRKVLGEKYVDDAIAKADDFMKPLQQYLTEHAWGAAWTRPGLDLKTRSMLNLAMLTALNRPHELRIHLRGAIRNGVTKEEMQEIFLQCGVYCGAPAALESFKIAREVLAEPVDKT
ncbi:MAG: 4-carboxymuconolactone decarboxylase [Betaproteobacteria bacterium]|nr:4-carboxymuconolactone decarboxylase [Betaproteobacteria bacterium]PWB64361.1 MAG: 4-carboxymuconolactone decarboxylase [Betaproteobacteria bacterium]